MIRRLCCTTATLFVIALTGAQTAGAAQVSLGTAGTFAVLGGSTVTNTGPSVLNGDLGVSPGTALVGFGSPAVVNGATHANDAVAQGAQSDLTTAYDVAAAQPVTADLTGQDLGGLSLMAGNYRYDSSAQLTGQVTLDAAGDPNAQFVFMIGTTLTTASASSVRLINGASPCNVFWQVGSSATLGTTTEFAGNILALQSITLNNGATVQGRVLARNGAVSLDTNTITRPACAAQTPTDGGT
ncbi:MAG: ice-binding family protein, partial [Solirubrobacteraceae bacterium]